MYINVNSVITRYGFVGAFLCGTMIVFVYRFACLFMRDEAYFKGTLSLIIVILAIIMNIRGIIWGNLLSQVGKPKFEAIVNIATVISNIMMNLIFINLFGMIGAAIGTAISYFLFSVIQKIYLKRELNI